MEFSVLNIVLAICSGHSHLGLTARREVGLEGGWDSGEERGSVDLAREEGGRGTVKGRGTGRVVVKEEGT